jgi:hypothetical protein
MKKYITLSLLIVSTAFTHAMEYTCYLDSFSLSSLLPAWFPFSQVQYTSNLVSDLQANKNEFENQLSFNPIVKLQGMTTLLYAFDTDDIKADPYTFLQYCYYYRHWEDDAGMMQLKDLDALSLEECYKTQIDGYSALGAAIIAENASGYQKYTFIQKLINLGFEPTPKDIGLAELILYDNIPAKQKETIILFLCNHQENNLSLLLPEIKTQIIQYMIQLFKDNFYLLPETSLNDL